MTARRQLRPVRVRVFFGCEGESELAYGVLLHRLVDYQRRLHIDAVALNPGGGDPLALAESAFKLVRQREHEFGSPYAVRAVLLDSDRLGQCPERDAKVRPTLYAGRLMPVWQRPAHEGFLLRHIAGCSTLLPPTAGLALTRLRREWPDYEKGISASYLQHRITLADVARTCDVEPDLAAFLAAIKFFD